MKKVKYVFLFVLCLVLSLGSSVTALADDYSTYPYYIKNYDVNITVNEDNSCHITENIDCFFNQYRHGIYRYIPVYFSVYRADESFINVGVKIKHAKCSDKTSNSIQNDNFVMQIGDEDETIIGEKSYTISYDYYVGPDNLTDADEFYFNIIGDGWDTVIDKCNFTITMPKEFDSSKLGFSTGNYGFVGTDIVDYKVDGNVITGHTTAPLREYEALTVRTELDDGYFAFDYAHEKMLGALMIAIPAIVLAFVLIIWLKFGKDKKVIETVEFYPPEGMNSLEVSYWYNGKVEKKEIVAILIELANEGFIEITEDSKDAYIHRLRNYDGDDEDKRQLFDSLFKNGKLKGTYVKELQYRMAGTAENIANRYVVRVNQAKAFDSKSLLLRVLCWVLSVASYALSCYIYTLAFIPNSTALHIGFVLALISFLLSSFVRKRSDEGYENLCKVKSFKTFLETAEKERLEALVEENPSYFYDILPYAYVLGVSSKWIRKFEKIAMDPPHWYYGSNPYTYIWMANFMRSSVPRMGDTIVTPKPSEHNGGSYGGGGDFSGGGGFSGGGFGGGGGGSW